MGNVLMHYHFGGENIVFQMTHQTLHIAYPPPHARTFRYIDGGKVLIFRFVMLPLLLCWLLMAWYVLLRVARRGTVPMIDFNGFHFGRDQSGDNPKNRCVGRACMHLTEKLGPEQFLPTDLCF